MKKILRTTKKQLRLIVSLAIVTLLALAVAVGQKPQQVKAAVSSSNPCVGSAAPAAWHHVIVLVFENKVYSDVINNSAAPFSTSLANKCATATNWKDGNTKVDGTSDGGWKSKPNYYVFSTGSPAAGTAIGNGQDDYTTQSSVDNIYRAVRDTGKTAKSYVEGITSNPTPCDVTLSTSSSGSYHDSHRYFNGTGDKAYCNSHDVDLSKFTTDLNNGTLPEFAIVFPKNTSNMHDNSVSSGDTWAQNFLNPIFDSNTYKSGDTAVFYMWDEDTPIPNVLVAPSVAPGTKITNTSHYAALKTWEEMLGTRQINDSSKATSLTASVFGGGGCGTSCPPPPGDTTPPTVSITAPANGSTTSADPVAVTANAADNVGVKQVEFFVNGTSKSIDTTSPYSFNWATSGLASGTYTIKAVATDTASPANTAQTTVSVNYVAPAGCSVTIPSTSLGTATINNVNIPSTGTYHAWSRLLAPDSTNNSYFLQVDSDCPTVVGDSAISANSWTWVDYKDGNSATKNNMNLTAGTHTIKLIGREPNVGVDRVLFLSDTCTPTGTGDNCLTSPTPPPTVTLTYPPTGQVLHGTETLTANATAGTGTTIANVEFYNGFTSLGKDTSAPYTLPWDTTKEADGSYIVNAVATDALGQKSALSSATVSILNADSTPPSQPGNLHTTSVTSGEVKLAWNASTDNKAVTGYNIYINGAGTPTATVTGTTYDDTTVSPNTGYIYQVEAVDAAGNKSTKAALAVTTPAATDTTPPSTPSNVKGTPSQGKVDLTWTASTDNVAVQDYLVRRDGVVVATVTGTSYSDTTVQPSTTYKYAIVARDTSGNSSAASTEISVTTPNLPPPSDTTPPSVPQNVTAVAPTSSQVNVSWDASTDNVAVAGYKVYRSDQTSPIATVTNATSFGDATVTPGQKYSYSVLAYDAALNLSAKSAAATVTVPNADNNTIFSDNFDSGSSYWAPVKGTWSVASDGTQGNVYHQDADGDAWSTAEASTLANYSVEANIKPVSFITGTASSQFAALYGRWQDQSHWYYVVLRSTGVIELKKNVGNVYTVLASKQTSITPGTWYKVKLDMNGSNLNVSLNGVQTLSATDSSIAQGKIGLGTYYAKANFDDVKVTQATTAVTTTLGASADSFVSAQYPNRNYGKQLETKVDAKPVRSALYKFDVSGINGRLVTNATLQLFTTDGSVTGGQIYSVSNLWTETGVTLNNAPSPAAGTPPITQIGATTTGKWVQIDVTKLFKADGTYSIRINSDNAADVARYGTRESLNPPKLTISSQSVL